VRAGPGRWWWFPGIVLVAHAVSADPLFSMAEGRLDLASGTAPCDPLRLDGSLGAVHGPLVAAWATLPPGAEVRFEFRAVHPSGPVEALPDPGLCAWLRHGYVGGTVHVTAPGNDGGADPTEDELLIFAVKELEILDGGGMFGCDLVQASVELVGGRWRMLLAAGDDPWRGELLGELVRTGGRGRSSADAITLGVEATLFGESGSAPVGPPTVHRTTR